MRGLVDQLGAADRLDKWRQEEAKDLTATVQAAITRLQNPDNCSWTTKKLVCHMTWGGCGFGCVLHHTVYCLISALATGRVLILSDLQWPHSNLVIKTFLRPLSTTCTNYTGNIAPWYKYIYLVSWHHFIKLFLKLYLFRLY